MLNTYDLDLPLLAKKLIKLKIMAIVRSGALLVVGSRSDETQSAIDKIYFDMPDLTPVQFYFLLAKSGLDVAIKALLPPLQLEDIHKYAMYKAYLSGARHYEFPKALAMYEDIKAKILAENSELDFTVGQLKTMWTEASHI